jgi:hypothetical protein
MSHLTHDPRERQTQIIREYLHNKDQWLKAARVIFREARPIVIFCEPNPTPTLTKLDIATQTLADKLKRSLTHLIPSDLPLLLKDLLLPAARPMNPFWCRAL